MVHIMCKKKICFVALRAYPLLAKRNMGYGGGPEVAQYLLAKELVKHDFDVTFVVYGSPPLIEQIDGINIIKVPYKGKLKALKAIFIWKSMKKANAQIYYHRSGATPIVSLFCYAKKKKFICHIASDRCVTKRGISYYRLWELDIKLADVVIVQSNFQKLMLMKNFHRGGILIRTFFPIAKGPPPFKDDPPIVLWVGSMSRKKQPLQFLKLAKNMPDATFQMIGGIGDDKGLNEFIKKTSKRILNLDFLGYIPFYEIDEYFKQATILVNTSKFEGYPNAFIQAWMNYTPTVTLNVDPDEVIVKNNLGFHSRTFEQILQDVRILLKDKQLRQKMGRNARRYVKREHNAPKIISKYIKIFDFFN